MYCKIHNDISRAQNAADNYTESSSGKCILKVPEYQIQEQHFWSLQEKGNICVHLKQVKYEGNNVGFFSSCLDKSICFKMKF